MGTLLVIIWAGSIFAYALLSLFHGVVRTKSLAQWTKGLNLGQKKSLDELYELLNGLQHPAKKTVEYIAEEKIVVKTDIYDFDVETIEDESGNTIVKFLRNKLIFRKAKRKKVVLYLDELYYFLKAAIGEIDVEEAKKVYDGNIKVKKILNILATIFIVFFVIIIILALLGG